MPKLLLSRSDTELAIVTGAHQGIGLAIARALAASGRAVAVVDIQEAIDTERFAQQFPQEADVHYFNVDITDEKQCHGFFDELVQHFGRRASILVNNAAVQYWSTLLELSLEQWRHTLEVNLTGSFLMTQRFAREFALDDSLAQGSIINLGSGCNHLAFPSLVSYSTSKGGIEMLTKSAALELGPQGIRVNCIAPGAIETERTKSETAGYEERWSPLTPQRRVGQVDDVADAVLALCEPGMRFVSGQTLGVDGGLFSRAVWPEEY